MTPRTINSAAVATIVGQYDARPEMLVQILQKIVQQCGWVSEEVIRQLAGALNLSRADVYGVVEYYHDFRTEPPGEHIVKICQAEACQAMGSRELTEHANSVIHDDTTLERARSAIYMIATPHASMRPLLRCGRRAHEHRQGLRPSRNVVRVCRRQ